MVQVTKSWAIRPRHKVGLWKYLEGTLPALLGESKLILSSVVAMEKALAKCTT